MTASLATVSYIGATILFILSLGGLANPETARRGNLFGMIGMGAVIAVIGLVANAILLVVRGRVKENAVLRTLGYPGRAIMLLVVSEGGMLGFLGGLLGTGLAWSFLRWQSFTLGSEGHTLAIRPEAATALTAILAALVLGLLAAVVPALQAIRQPIVKNLR